MQKFGWTKVASALFFVVFLKVFDKKSFKNKDAGIVGSLYFCGRKNSI